MTKTRVGMLLRLDFMATWHRLRFDWAQELIAFLCAGVLLAVFGYMVHDFLTDKIAGLGMGIRQALTFGAAFGMALVAGCVIGAVLRRRANLAAFAKTRGEFPETISRYRKISQIIVATFLSGLAWALIFNLVGSNLGTNQVIATLSIGAIGAGAAYFLSFAEDDRVATVSTLDFIDYSRWRAALKLRLAQIICRNRTSQIFCALAGLLTIANIWQSMRGAPPFINGILAMAISMLTAFPLTIQLKEDLQYAWSERLMGISHREFTFFYYRLAVALTIPYFFISLAGALLRPSFDVASLSAALIVPLGPLLTPSLMFQVEPRKPQITGLVIGLVVLFLGTGLLVHPAMLVLVPITMYYAGQYQEGRYYRA